jgi:hypothetical protein
VISFSCENHPGMPGWRQQETKKEEFAGITLNMVPGNSFPQICVVSETILGNVRKEHNSTKVSIF